MKPLYLQTALAAALTAMATPSLAMNIGEFKVLSYNAQPLRAMLPIEAQPWEWRNMWASAQTNQSGLGLTAMLFKPTGDQTKGYMEIKSKGIITQPMVDIQIRLESGHKTTVHHAPIFINTNTVQAVHAATPISQVNISTDLNTPVVQEKNKTPEVLTFNIKRGDTIYKLIRNHRPRDWTLTRAFRHVFNTNRHAFSGKPYDFHTLRVGSTIVIDWNAAPTVNQVVNSRAIKSEPRRSTALMVRRPSAPAVQIKRDPMVKVSLPNSTPTTRPIPRPPSLQIKPQINISEVQTNANIVNAVSNSEIVKPPPTLRGRHVNVPQSMLPTVTSDDHASVLRHRIAKLQQELSALQHRN